MAEIPFGGNPYADALEDRLGDLCDLIDDTERGIYTMADLTRFAEDYRAIANRRAEATRGVIIR